MSARSVTAVIPAYRASATIGRAVQSVLSQTRKPQEILVIDDGSPDDVCAALGPYRNEVTLIRQPNAGAASARNLGIERSHGELIALLDADDYWEPEKLEEQLSVFETHSDLGLAASRHFAELPGRERTGPHAMHGVVLDRKTRASGERAFDLASHIWTSTVVVRREALGGHRFVSGLEPAEDRDLWVRLVASAPVYVLSKPLATAVLVPESLSRTDHDRDCVNMLRVVHRHSSLLGRRGLRRWEAQVYRRWAGGNLSQGLRKEARRMAWQRWRRQPFCFEAWWILSKCVAQSVTRRGAASEAPPSAELCEHVKRIDAFGERSTLSGNDDH